MTAERSATQPEDLPEALPAADFGTRFSAFVIDGSLLFTAQWVIFIVLSRQFQAVGLTSVEPCAAGQAPTCEGPSTALWAILLLFLLASTVAYHAVFEGRYGATPGKRWMGLRVVDVDGTTPIGLIAGLLRSLVRQAFWLSLFFILDASPLAINLPSALFLLVPVAALAPIVWAAFSPDGRGGHDMVARTVVVRAGPGTLRLRPRQTPAPAIVEIFESESAEESV